MLHLCQKAGYTLEYLEKIHPIKFYRIFKIVEEELRAKTNP